MTSYTKQVVQDTAFVIAMWLALSTLFFAGCGRQPLDGKDGAAGAQGVMGSQGTPGPAGETGATGTPGANGADAASVTVVQLCPTPTSYPATFTEVAFCIGGKLYATYSTNGGFSTELPPGSYASNGVGSSCTFIVGTACQVTN